MKCWIVLPENIMKQRKNSFIVMEIASKFKEKSTDKAADRNHRKTINFNIGKYNAVVPLGKQQFSELELGPGKSKEFEMESN
jgi:L-lactate dehydrogenase complex protein LldF